jgi:hypothetical protein
LAFPKLQSIYTKLTDVPEGDTVDVDAEVVDVVGTSEQENNMYYACFSVCLCKKI